MSEYTNELVHVPVEILSNSCKDEERLNYNSANNNFDDDGIIDNLLVATKAGDAANAVKSVLHRFRSQSSRIILLTNGVLGVRDELLKVISNNEKEIELVLGSVTHGSHQDVSSITFAEKHNETNSNAYVYNVVHAGRGNIWLAENNDKIVSSMLSLSKDLDCKSVNAEEMECLLWEKLASNCIINPLTTLYQCKNGDLRHIFKEDDENINLVLKEISEVAKIHHNLSDIDNDRFSFNNLKAFVDHVINVTAPNKSSMLQDFEQGRRTEINYLNGYISGLGSIYGVDTTANDRICEEINRLQEELL